MVVKVSFKYKLFDTLTNNAMFKGQRLAIIVFLLNIQMNLILYKLQAWFLKTVVVCLV